MNDRIVSEQAQQQLLKPKPVIMTSNSETVMNPMAQFVFDAVHV